MSGKSELIWNIGGPFLDFLSSLKAGWYSFQHLSSPTQLPILFVGIIQRICYWSFLIQVEFTVTRSKFCSSVKRGLSANVFGSDWLGGVNQPIGANTLARDSWHLTLILRDYKRACQTVYARRYKLWSFDRKSNKAYPHQQPSGKGSSLCSK